MAALKRLDKFRAMAGKPKYESLDGMIEQYMAETAERDMNWTREEAESECCRYLMRQALADAGTAAHAKAALPPTEPVPFCLEVIRKIGSGQTL